MLLLLLSIVVSLALLVWSADRFVFGAAALARNFGISPLVVGMTIVAMGSSAPEMLVAAAASLKDSPDTAVGNVLGSNITNIALVLGATALLRPLSVSSGTLRRELPLVLGITLLAVALLFDGQLQRIDGLLLVAAFIGFLLFVFRSSQRGDGNDEDKLLSEVEDEVPEGVSTNRAIFWGVVGLGLLLFSSNWLVESAIQIARIWGVSDLVIGLTIIAVGTSLPELAASVAGVLRNEDDLSLGNIIGSNIFNLLAVLPIPALLAPAALDPAATTRDTWVMLAATVLLLLVSWGRNRRINRWEGGLLLSGFIGYQLWLFAGQ